MYVKMLDDDEKREMMQKLAAAFDFAATHAATAELAAIQIAGLLQNSGYRIVQYTSPDTKAALMNVMRAND